MMIKIERPSRSRLERFQKEIRVFWANKALEAWKKLDNEQMFSAICEIPYFDNVPLGDYETIEGFAAYVGLTLIIDQKIPDYSKVSKFNFKAATIDSAYYVVNASISGVVKFHKYALDILYEGVTGDFESMTKAKEFWLRHPNG